MNANARRQIKDIQFRAERLINGSPTIDDIEEFDQYNEELKKYLISNLLDTELIERVKQIPRVLDEPDSQLVPAEFFLPSSQCLHQDLLHTFRKDIKSKILKIPLEKLGEPTQPLNFLPETLTSKKPTFFRLRTLSRL